MPVCANTVPAPKSDTAQDSDVAFKIEVDKRIYMATPVFIMGQRLETKDGTSIIKPEAFCDDFLASRLAELLAWLEACVWDKIADCFCQVAAGLCAPYRRFTVDGDASNARRNAVAKFSGEEKPAILAA